MSLDLLISLAASLAVLAVFAAIWSVGSSERPADRRGRSDDERRPEPSDLPLVDAWWWPDA